MFWCVLALCSLILQILFISDSNRELLTYPNPIPRYDSCTLQMCSWLETEVTSKCIVCVFVFIFTCFWARNRKCLMFGLAIGSKRIGDMEAWYICMMYLWLVKWKQTHMFYCKNIIVGINVSSQHSGTRFFSKTPHIIPWLAPLVEIPNENESWQLKMESEGYQLCGLVNDDGLSFFFLPCAVLVFFIQKNKKHTIEACDSNSLVIRICNMLPFPTLITPPYLPFLALYTVGSLQSRELSRSSPEALMEVNYKMCFNG